jgi:DNA-binding response OmpR family regulator
MSKPVVLLAERNPELRGRLFTQLLWHGYEVIDAQTTVDVLRTVRHRRCVDLFVMSVSLDTPGDGVELAQLLCQCEHRPRVILLAEKEPQGWAADAQAVGATAYFEQPFSCEDVIACVRRICASSFTDLPNISLIALGFSGLSLN